MEPFNPCSAEACVRKPRRVQLETYDSHTDYFGAHNYRLGRDVFRDDLGLALWFTEPASVLKGAVPLEKLRTAKGREAVVLGLKQIVCGVIV